MDDTLDSVGTSTHSIATLKTDEVRELRAGKWSLLKAVIGTLLNFLSPIFIAVAPLIHSLSSPSRVHPSEGLLVLFGVLGLLHLKLSFNLLCERLAASRSYLRADEAGITLHDPKRDSDQQHVFVAWEKIASLVEVEGAKESPDLQTRAGTMTLRDQTDNTLLQWSLKWPTTFTSSQRTETFHQYLHTRVPSRCVQAVIFDSRGIVPFDELRAGENLKIPIYALLEERKLLAFLAFFVAMIGSFCIRPEAGIVALVLWQTFIGWYCYTPCFLVLNASAITFTYGSRTQVMKWEDLASINYVQGSHLGNLALCDWDEQRLVLPVPRCWNGQVRRRALRILYAEMGRQISIRENEAKLRLSGAMTSKIRISLGKKMEELVPQQPLLATSSYVYNDNRIVLAIAAPLAGLFLSGHFLGEGLGMIVFFSAYVCIALRCTAQAPQITISAHEVSVTRGTQRQTIEWNDIVKIKDSVERGFLSRDVVLYGHDNTKVVLPHPQQWQEKEA